MVNKFISMLEDVVQPLAVKMGNNKYVKAVTNGMMGIIPITVGVSFVSILVNLPMESWQTFLQSISILGPATELISATTSLLAIYIVISIAYSFAKEVGQDPKATTLIATAVFILLMPQKITLNGETINALASSNLGSNGIFVAIIVGILCASFYDFLIKKNFKFKMPEQVPPNVSESMTPIIAAMIILTIAFSVKYGLSLTSYGDVFTLLFTFLTAPAMLLGKTAWSAIFLYFIMRAVFWFFGIHPSPLNAIYFPLAASVTAANIEAMVAGQQLPYIEFTIMSTLCMIGGTACTLGLALNMLFAKSERYRSLNKIAFIPGLFNINEPYVFGVPLMLNPIMLLPMILAPLSGGLIGMTFVRMGLINSDNFNPAVAVAWVLPTPITAFMRGGIALLIACLLAIFVQTVIYYPFFKILDKKAFQEELDMQKQDKLADAVNQDAVFEPAN